MEHKKKGNCKHIKHECIVSCETCWQLENKIERVQEVVDDIGEEVMEMMGSVGEIMETVGERLVSIKRILTGGSH